MQQAALLADPPKKEPALNKFFFTALAAIGNQSYQPDFTFLDSIIMMTINHKTVDILMNPFKKIFTCLPC